MRIISGSKWSGDRPSYGFHLSFVDDSFLARIGVDVAGDKAGFSSSAMVDCSSSGQSM